MRLKKTITRLACLLAISGCINYNTAHSGNASFTKQTLNAAEPSPLLQISNNETPSTTTPDVDCDSSETVVYINSQELSLEIDSQESTPSVSSTSIASETPHTLSLSGTLADHSNTVSTSAESQKASTPIASDKTPSITVNAKTGAADFPTSIPSATVDAKTGAPDLPSAIPSVTVDAKTGAPSSIPSDIPSVTVDAKTGAPDLPSGIPSVTVDAKTGAPCLPSGIPSVTVDAKTGAPTGIPSVTVDAKTIGHPDISSVPHVTIDAICLPESTPIVKPTPPEGQSKASCTDASADANAYAVENYGMRYDPSLTFDNCGYRFPSYSYLYDTQDAVTNKCIDTVDSTANFIAQLTDKDVSGLSERGFRGNVYAYEEDDFVVTYVFYALD